MSASRDRDSAHCPSRFTRTVGLELEELDRPGDDSFLPLSAGTQNEWMTPFR